MDTAKARVQRLLVTAPGSSPTRIDKRSRAGRNAARVSRETIDATHLHRPLFFRVVYTRAHASPARKRVQVRPAERCNAALVEAGETRQTRERTCSSLAINHTRVIQAWWYTYTRTGRIMTVLNFHDGHHHGCPAANACLSPTAAMVAACPRSVERQLQQAFVPQSGTPVPLFGRDARAAVRDYICSGRYAGYKGRHMAQAP
ncbi:hypothetical protein MRX96_045616 [Rhipicephalus microplus]